MSRSLLTAAEYERLKQASKREILEALARYVRRPVGGHNRVGARAMTNAERCRRYQARLRKAREEALAGEP